MTSDTVIYITENIDSSNNITPQEDDIVFEYINKKNIEEINRYSPKQIAGYIFEFKSPTKLYKTRQNIEHDLEAEDCIIITEATTKSICEEKKRNNIHIPISSSDIRSTLKKYTKIFTDSTSDTTQLPPKESGFDLSKLFYEFNQISMCEKYQKEYTTIVEEYTEAVYENSVFDQCIIVIDKLSDANPIQFFSSTGDIGEYKQELATLSKNVDGDKIDVITTDDHTSPISNNRVSSADNQTDEYNTHIIKSLSFDQYKISGSLHLLKRNEIAPPLSNRQNVAINNTGRVISSEIEAIEAQNKLREKIELLEKFRYIISHDLMSPIATAKGRTEIAKTEFESDHIDIAYDAIERVENMIDSTERLLDAGGSIEVNGPVSMRETCEEAWKIIDVDEADLIVENDFEVYADIDQLKTILENLFKNSIQHGGRDTTITVYKKTPIQTSTRRDPDDTFSVVVEDNGKGIDPDIEDELFERQKTTKQGSDTSGFGLSIVKSAVEAHGWEINVTNSNKGAKFVISDVY